MCSSCSPRHTCTGRQGHACTRLSSPSPDCPNALQEAVLPVRHVVRVKMPLSQNFLT